MDQVTMTLLERLVEQSSRIVFFRRSRGIHRKRDPGL